jgi:hypothetical protein
MFMKLEEVAAMREKESFNLRTEIFRSELARGHRNMLGE